METSWFPWVPKRSPNSSYTDREKEKEMRTDKRNKKGQESKD